MTAAEYVPDEQLPHCRMCGDPRSKHDGLPRRYGAKCSRCDCPGYQPKRHVADWDERLDDRWVQ